MDYTYKYASPIGEILLASDGRALVGLWFVGQKCFADVLAENCIEKSLPIFEQAGMTNEQMKEYCAKVFPTLKRWKKD